MCATQLDFFREDDFANRFRGSEYANRSWSIFSEESSLQNLLLRTTKKLLDDRLQETSPCALLRICSQHWANLRRCLSLRRCISGPEDRRTHLTGTFAFVYRVGFAVSNANKRIQTRYTRRDEYAEHFRPISIADFTSTLHRRTHPCAQYAHSEEPLSGRKEPSSELSSVYWPNAHTSTILIEKRQFTIIILNERFSFFRIL